MDFPLLLWVAFSGLLVGVFVMFITSPKTKGWTLLPAMGFIGSIVAYLLLGIVEMWFLFLNTTGQTSAPSLSFARVIIPILGAFAVAAWHARSPSDPEAEQGRTPHNK